MHRALTARWLNRALSIGEASASASASASVPLFLCPAVVASRWTRSPLVASSPRPSIYSRRLNHTDATTIDATKIDAASTLSDEALQTLAPQKRLPINCSGCGAFTQTNDPQQLGYFDLESKRVKKWLTPPAPEPLTGQDGLDKLRMDEAECPAPGEDEVLVEVHSVSLNYRDTEVAMGLYNHHQSVDHPPAIVPASDMCGVVVAVGPVSNNTSDPYKNPAFQLKEGDRVISTFAPKHLSGQIKATDIASGLGGPAPGVLTQYRVFPTYGVVKIPDYLSDDEAACLPIAAVTAWMSLNCMRPNGEIIGKGESVVCQGTGGVSISAAQIASAAGADAIVTSSSDEKLERASKLGAKTTINYRNNPDWENAVLAATSDEGADIIIEVGGAQTLRKSFECVRFGGLISCIGYLSGKQDEAGDRTNTNLLCLKRNVTLKGIMNGPRTELERMLKFYDEKKIRPVVDRVWKFEEADQALKYLFSGGHFGKVVIKVKE